ncbi:hypothetical protein [Mucilaginibacter sp. 10B2]|uniref:hypothetical protein n=1 Tax=Mucilaginibacter sp. 10B2 TaxID=3048574 RepID=UPI002B23D321|nr:hypothetical protein [Mucilaginibacter sp. 10B2]MEB0280526.1 hypothetical protein [Mucilaginibacter sp. 10B2]
MDGTSFWKFYAYNITVFDANHELIVRPGISAVILVFYGSFIPAIRNIRKTFRFNIAWCAGLAGFCRLYLEYRQK